VTLVEQQGAGEVGAGVGGVTMGDCGRLNGVIVGVFACGVFSLCQFSVPVDGVGYDNSLHVDTDSGPNTS